MVLVQQGVPTLSSSQQPLGNFTNALEYSLQLVNYNCRGIYLPFDWKHTYSPRAYDLKELNFRTFQFRDVAIIILALLRSKNN